MSGCWDWACGEVAAASKSSRACGCVAVLHCPPVRDLSVTHTRKSCCSLVDSMDRLGLAALVYPTWNQPPLRVGDKNADPYDGNNSPLIAPHTGSPAITVPMGFAGAWVEGCCWACGVDSGQLVGRALLAAPRVLCGGAFVLQETHTRPMVECLNREAALLPSPHCRYWPAGRPAVPGPPNG